MKKLIYFIFLLAIVLLNEACEQGATKVASESEKGIIANMLPPSIRRLFDVTRGADPSYHEEAKQAYQAYIKNNHRDSALFCLIAWHEVLDQNYIYDSIALAWAKKHLFDGLGTKENQQELMKLGYYIGSMYYTLREADSLIHWFNFTRNHPSSLPRTVASCRTVLGSCYGNLNQMDSSIRLGYENLEFYKQIGDSQNYSISCSNLARDYRYISAYELANQYSAEALKIAKLRNDTFSQVMVGCAYLNTLMESKPRSSEVSENVYLVNNLMSNYSKSNLTLIEAQCLSNLAFNGEYERMDSIKYWLDILKDVSEKRRGPSDNTYLIYYNRYTLYRNKSLVNLQEIRTIASNALIEKEYKDAHGGYFLLSQDALHRKDYASAYAYKDTLSRVDEKVYEQTKNGKLYELNVKYKSQLKDQQLKLNQQELKSKKQEIILLGSLLTVLALAFVTYLMWQKRKQEKIKVENEEKYTQMLMENTEEERRRIARDLHDSVGHELLSVRNSLSSQINVTENKIDAILNEVREISRNLFPVMFEEVGLRNSLEQLADSTYKNNGIFVNTEINYTYSKLKSNVELNIYRIIQEGINNIIKYSEAKSCLVAIEESPKAINIIIKDKGKGFNVEETLKKGNAFGLISMQQRAKAIGTNITIASNSEGTSIELTLSI